MRAGSIVAIKRLRKKIKSGARLSPEITEAAICGDRHAKAAFDKLRKVDKGKLVSLLRQIPFAPTIPVPLVGEMTDRIVRNLPKRIRSLATVISMVNESPWVGPNGWRKHKSEDGPPSIYPKLLSRTATPERKEPAVNLLLAVPNILKMYADFLEEMIIFFDRTFKRDERSGVSL
jgi:hypothetical protein